MTRPTGDPVRDNGGARIAIKALAKASLIALFVGTILGGAIGAGWALWGDYRGQPSLVVGVGLVGGAALALPIIAYVIIDVQRWPIRRKAATSLLPLFVLSFCVPAYGGPVMFLQLCAILVPSFLWTRAWITLLVGATGGFAFLGAWYLLYSAHLAPIRTSDDIFVFYPYAIGVVAMGAAVGKAVRRRLEKRRPGPTGYPG